MGDNTYPRDGAMSVSSDLVGDFVPLVNQPLSLVAPVSPSELRKVWLARGGFRLDVPIRKQRISLVTGDHSKGHISGIRFPLRRRLYGVFLSSRLLDIKFLLLLCF
jgi:hypothetical protein